MSVIKVNTIQNANGTTALTIAANGQMTLANTSLQLTGGQIKFPATQIASGDANTLDDYEEGTWIPTWNGGTISAYSRCQYVKIGNQVTVTADLTLGTPSGSSAITISGLPFTTGSSSNQSVGPVMIYNVGLSGANFATTYLYGGVNNVVFYYSASGGVWATIVNTNVASGSRIIFTVTYFVEF